MKTQTRDVPLGLNQDVWWKDATGVIRLIDDLDPQHRAFICRFLVDTAARRHYRARLQWYTWDVYFSGMGGYAGVPDEFMRLTDQDVRNLIRKEQDRGDHLEMVWGSLLFQRMVRGVEDVVAQWPGVLPCATVGDRQDGQDGGRR